MNYADPKEGRHQDWNTLIYSYGRNEVRNYLAGNALDPLALAFLAHVLFLEGQAQVSQAGYIPLTESQRQAALPVAGLPTAAQVKVSP